MTLPNFTIKGKKFELFIAKDKHIELYEANDPLNGIILNDKKELNLFVNSLTDLLEKLEIEGE